MLINQTMESIANHTKPSVSAPTNTHKPTQTPATNVQNAKALATQTSQQNVEAKPVSDEELQQAVDKIQNFTNKSEKNLKFSVDEDTGKTVVKIQDSQTLEIIRQFPSEEAITIARTLDKMQGLLISDKA